MSQKLTKVRLQAFEIEERYDGDNDIIPGAPRVLFTEMQLVGMIQTLCDVIEGIENKLLTTVSTETTKIGES